MTYTLGDMGALGYFEDDEYLDNYFETALYNPYEEYFATENVSLTLKAPLPVKPLLHAAKDIVSITKQGSNEEIKF